jgi:glycosyltransferase involved in cell wall biosynthesis
MSLQGAIPRLDDTSTPAVTADYSPASTVSVVIPTLNEAKNLAWVLERLPDCVDEVIIVDGRSTDDTIAVALKVRPDARILLERAPGKGAAVRAGFAQARGDLIVMLDADGSMDPSEICRYLAPLENGYELVKGSRFMPSGGTTDISRIRALGNLALVNRLFGCRFTELCYGFMAFRREALPRLRLASTGFEIETEIVVHAMRAGLRVVEVPSFESERHFGKSNLHAVRDGVRVLRTLLAAHAKRWPVHEGLGAAPLTDRRALRRTARVAMRSSAARPAQPLLSR